MRALLLLLLAALACGGGPAAPPVEAIQEACTDDFCVRYPEGWEVEQGEDFLNFRHPRGPDLLATISGADMALIVESSGGSWPSSPENVSRDFWSLLEGGQGAELEELVVEPSGSVLTRGRVEAGVLWHKLIPLAGGPQAWALAVRAPSMAWEPHARVFLEGVTFR
ncbi:MAG: hypothetical protein M3N51_02145 [Actinomycetota bacterium]|nr:hypothetical protein [Actinomycetota bacterium]